MEYLVSGNFGPLPITVICVHFQYTDMKWLHHLWSSFLPQQ